MKIQVLDHQSLIQKIDSSLQSEKRGYYAMYSSWFDGVTLDPQWMLLPIDDHMVHRGDGVFEYIKAVNRKVFLLDAHLKRLKVSAERIGLNLPKSLDEIQDIVLQMLKLTDQASCGVRIFVSRGPGSFTPNPYEPQSAQLYILTTELKSIADSKYQQGVTAGRSQIPIKETWFAQVKSCNYLQNVLMKKEAIDKNLDFTIGFDAKNCVAEGSTENIIIVDKNNNLCHPPLDHILRGTTMIRLFELAQAAQLLPAVIRPITEKDLLEAKEVMMIGTTMNTLPVATYEGQKIGTGDFALSKKFNQMLAQDLEQSPFTY